MVWPLHSQPTMVQSGGNRPYGCVQVPTGVECGDKTPPQSWQPFFWKSFINPDEGCECAHPSQPIGMTGCHGCARSQGQPDDIEYRQMYSPNAILPKHWGFHFPNEIRPYPKQTNTERQEIFKDLLTRCQEQGRTSLPSPAYSHCVQ